MEWVNELAITFVRAVLISFVTLFFSVLLKHVSDRSSAWKQFLLIIALGTLTLPGLLIAHGYADILSYFRHPLIPTELMYAGVMIARGWPWCWLMLQLTDHSEQTDLGIHLLKMSRSVACKPSLRKRFYPYGQWLAKIGPAWCLTVLIVFQEFEIASLMNLTNWTVKLFDAQAAGLNWQPTLLWSAVALALQLLLIIPLIRSDALRKRHDIELTQQGASLQSRWLSPAQSQRLGASVMVMSLLAILLPVGWLLSDVIPQWSRITFSSQWRMLGWGMLGNGLIGVCSLLMLWGLHRVTRNSPSLQKAFLAIGFCGELLLAMFGLGLQVMIPEALLSTGLPLLSSALITLWIWPRYWILNQTLQLTLQDSSSHLLQLLQFSSQQSIKKQAQQQLWNRSGQQNEFLLVVLFGWAYTEVLITSVTTSVGYETATVRLYNLMHYGHNVLLTMMCLVYSLIPFVLFTIIVARRR